MKMCFDGVPIFYLVQWSKHLRCGVFNDWSWVVLVGAEWRCYDPLSFKNVDLL